MPRSPVNASIPSIPSLPISYEDALPLLTALNGYGPRASSINEYWKGGGLGYLGIEYFIGPSPSTVAVNLVNDQEYVTTPIWNVVGIINGTLSDEVVILGNHRDAWIAGGAGDPNSGSAILNEVMRSFGEALKQGWRPSRTIVFCSWDGEEHGLLGSTEWVEEYLPWLSKSAVAYLNVDIGVSGPWFEAAASPLLDSLIYDVTSAIPSPNQTVPEQSVRDTWDGRILTMGSGSDFTAFQDHAGIPSLDVSFRPGRESAVYHYHSNYDSFDWMERFGDPGWRYHVTMARLFGLAAATLVERPIIAFGAADYARALVRYVDTAKKTPRHGGDGDDDGDGDDEQKLYFGALDHSLAALVRAGVQLDRTKAAVLDRLGRHVPWWKWWKKARLYREIVQVNAKYRGLERRFLYADGLDGRPWFKHVVFAPGLWTGYSGATFPGLVESIERRDWLNAQVSFQPPPLARCFRVDGICFDELMGCAQRWIGIIVSRVDAAAQFLHGD